MATASATAVAVATISTSPTANASIVASFGASVYISNDKPQN